MLTLAKIIERVFTCTVVHTVLVVMYINIVMQCTIRLYTTSYAMSVDRAHCTCSNVHACIVVMKCLYSV